MSTHAEQSAVRWQNEGNESSDLGGVHVRRIEVQTSKRMEIHDLTEIVREMVRATGVAAGLVTVNGDRNGNNLVVQNQVGRAGWSPGSTGPTGAVDPEHTNATAITDWQADIRGVTPAQETAVYSAAKQTAKRVFVRSIWCLNQGLAMGYSWR